jgi:MOSC domain-containing protein YiiM
MAKPSVDRIRLIEGLGVEGDSHAGVTVQHRSRVAVDPDQPNLRQVHFIGAELHDELRAGGLEVAWGQMGENITTVGLRLLDLPAGARFRIGDAVVRITGLRNPCHQLEGIAPGLMAAVLERDDSGNLIRRAGVMGVVEATGDVAAGDPIIVEFPDGDHSPLRPV